MHFSSKSQRKGRRTVAETLKPGGEQKKHHKLIFAHQNIDSLQNKIERLTHFLNDANPDLIVLTEHYVAQRLCSEKLENTRIPNYSLIGDFTRKQHQKGGVATFDNSRLKKLDHSNIYIWYNFGNHMSNNSS